MSAIAGFGSLKVAKEGTAVSRNPILGINTVAFDEPGFDIEGNRGAGTRGHASLRTSTGSTEQLSHHKIQINTTAAACQVWAHD